MQTGGFPEAVPSYKFLPNGANRRGVRRGCAAGASKFQFISCQAGNCVKLSESAEEKISVFLIKSDVIGVRRGGRASAEPVRHTFASSSQTEHFSATHGWVPARGSCGCADAKAVGVRPRDVPKVAACGGCGLFARSAHPAPLMTRGNCGCADAGWGVAVVEIGGCATVGNGRN